MPIRIRLADLEADRLSLIDLHQRNLNAGADKGRFDWLYHGNPHGKALAWLAFDEESGQGIGTAAAFPRQVYVGDSLRVGFVLGDFCIEPRFRSLALALQLQRACLEKLDSVGSALTYDFPSDRMMSIYKRMGIPATTQFVRWAKPLRADRQIGKLIKQPNLSKWLAAPVNRLMEWSDLPNETEDGCTIAGHEHDCGEEFTQLARSIGSLYGSCVERSAAYLNWRFRKHPFVHHELLTARRHGELVGYVVFAHMENDARVADLFGINDTSIWTLLLAAVCQRLRAQSVITLSLPALATNPWVKLLRKLGFRDRERGPIIVCDFRDDSTTSNSVVPPLFLTDGDRES